jgi:Ca-activated chloride channel homolog
MTGFLWPAAFLLLALVPALILLRIWAQRRRRAGLRYSSLSLILAAAPGSSRVRRHLPFALFLLGLGSLVIAIARPVSIVSVPTGQRTIILAMDVSRSMCATDIPPNRLLAAETAASLFVERHVDTTTIGVVAFAGFAETVQVPTGDAEVLLDVIESLTTGRRTAIGSAILESLDAIAEFDESVAPSVSEDDPPESAPEAVPQGAYAPAIIVLLTDGANNSGPEPIDAAQQAAARGVRVYTIGFGTASPEPGNPRCGQQFTGREPPEDPNAGGFGGGGGGGGGGGFRRAIDEPTLIAIAEATGGTYSPAESADELDAVFQSLPTELILKHEVTEVSVVFVGLGVLLVGAAMFLGLAWRPLTR